MKIIALAVFAICLSLASSASGSSMSGALSADPRWPGQGNESSAPPADFVPPELRDVQITEHLGQSLPASAIFQDTEHHAVTLGQFFDGKRPTLLVFAYHTCPMLCSFVLDHTAKALKEVGWTVGDQFDVVSISFDPHDTPESATKKRQQIFEKYGRGKIEGWHFLVGDEPNIRKVTSAIGFGYHYDERQGQYAHPAAIYLVTPGGKIARYLYGLEYDPNDIKIGLLEASEGRSITTTEKILLYCYHYDPQGKRYALFAMRIMRIGGGLTVLLLGGFVALLWRRERKKKKQQQQLRAAEQPS